MENIIIKATGTIAEFKPKNGKTYTLKELQKAVGGMVEIYPSKDRKKLFVMNENGMYQGLPVNIHATHLFGYNTGNWYELVGNVLFVNADTIV